MIFSASDLDKFNQTNTNDETQPFIPIRRAIRPPANKTTPFSFASDPPRNNKHPGKQIVYFESYWHIFKREVLLFE